MTGYMLRWQWMMLKRQLFSMEMMPLLIFNFIFQAAIIVFAIISRNQLAQNVMQVILCQESVRRIKSSRSVSVWFLDLLHLC